MRSRHDPDVSRGLAQVVVRGVALAGGGYVLTQVLTLGFYLALARLATPEEFGQLAAGSILVSIGLLFTESGMQAAVVQRPHRVEDAAATAVIATFVAGAAFALIALALSPLIGTFFDSGEIASVAAVMSGLLLLQSVPLVPSALLQRRFSFARRMVVEPAGVVAFGVTAVIATSNEMGVWGLVLGRYATAVTDIVLSWALARWRPRFSLASVGTWRELVAFGRFVFGATAVYRAGGQVPVALLGRFVGAGALGQFQYASRLAATPFAVMLAAASYVLFPAFARIADDPPRLRSGFVRSLRWMGTLGIPGGLILLPLGAPLATLVFGSVWADAGKAAMALCLYPAAGTLYSIVSEIFTANGRPQLPLKVHVLEVALGALAMAALLPFGLVGVAAGVSIGATGAAVYGLRLVNTQLGVSARSILREIGPPLLAAVTMAAIMLPVEALLVQADERGTALGLALLAAEFVAAILLYASVLHLLSPGRIREFVGLLRTAARSRQGADADVRKVPTDPTDDLLVP